MTDFAGLGLSSALVETLARIDYTQPTPIQEQTIPLVLKGRDVLGTAQTGTGKTGAFAIPVIEFLLNSPRGAALIMTPTRELAAQVQQVIKQMLSGQSAVKTALLIGGEPMPKQLAQLKARPRVIIGTPGRINDHLTRGSLMLHDARLLVLDETDRMLDMGFGIQIDQILKFMPKERQTLLFSATLPPAIVKISKKYLHNPERVEIGQASRPALNIDHKMEKATDDEKYPKLLNELEERQGSVIIFVKTKRGADKLALRLRKSSHEAEAIHGDLRQSQRDRVIKAFRNQRYRVMVATDVAARGLDIPHIEHVINYDLPQCAEDYIHRIGRTARAGAKGAALCYVSPADRGMWREVSRLLDPDAAPEADEGFNDNRRGGFRQKQGGNRGRGRNREFESGRGSRRFGNDERFERGERRFDGERREPRERQERQERQERRPRSFEDAPRFEKRAERDGYEARQGYSGKPRRERSERSERSDTRQDGGFKKQGGGNDFQRNERRFDGKRRAPQGERRTQHDKAPRKPRLDHDDQVLPNFIERPFKERPFNANEQGLFKKKSEKRHDGNKRPQGERKHQANGNSNVTRFDGPGSSYFRAESKAGKPQQKKRDGEYTSNSEGKKFSKPKGDFNAGGKPKRSFNGNKKRFGNKNAA